MQVGRIEQLTTNPVPINYAPHKFDVLSRNVKLWAMEKGIFAKATPTSQHKKTQEEVDELRDAIEAGNKEELIDALGDILVTLIIQAEMNEVDTLDCLESAYNVIKNRTGSMQDGIFVKDK